MVRIITLKGPTLKIIEILLGPFKTNRNTKNSFPKVVPFKVMISIILKGPTLKNNKKKQVFNGPTLKIIQNPSCQGSYLEHPKKSKFSRVRIITLKGPTLKILENTIWTS